VVTKRGSKAMKGRPQTKRSFPGRLTLEQWLARSWHARSDLVRRAQCDLLGSFRRCADKRCRRQRTCRGEDSQACLQRLWRLKKTMPKTQWREWSRLHDLKSLSCRARP